MSKLAYIPEIFAISNNPHGFSMSPAQATLMNPQDNIIALKASFVSPRNQQLP